MSRPTLPLRVLVAGIGNVLRGDDGFGPAVVQALLARGPLPAGVRAVELGIGGIGLVHELMDGYDAAVIVDAIARGGVPGTIYVVEPDVPSAAELSAREQAELADMHAAVPARALVLARAAGVLPRSVRIIGCEPAETEELSTRLTSAIATAVPAVVDRILAFVASLGDRDAVAGVQRRDEVLQVLFWLRGEGLGADVTVADVARFVEDETAVREVFTQLVEAGYLATSGGPDARYHLTALGETEARRRFVDEFDTYRARGHGECGVADCSCRTGGECTNEPHGSPR